MNIAEQKLNLIRQIDQLPEALLIELEKIILDWQKNKYVEELRTLWQEGLTSGSSEPLDMSAIKAEALRRYNEKNNHHAAEPNGQLRI